MKKRHIYLVLFVVLFASTVSVTGQIRPEDDREIFLGAPTGDVKPNVMILMDNSGSMNTAIYHPAYSPKINYKKNLDGEDLTLNGISTILNLSYGETYTTSSIKTFKICRGRQEVVSGETSAQGRYVRRISRRPRVWQVNKVFGTFEVDQTLKYYRNGRVRTTRIRAVVDMGSYWKLTVSNNTSSPRGNYTVWVEEDVISIDETEAYIKNTSEGCGALVEEITPVKIYGGSDSGQSTRYDLNYMYWLCFHATIEQINQVTSWATTGEFETGTYAGFTRIQGARRVIQDLTDEVYDMVRLGLTLFNSNNNGGIVQAEVGSLSLEDFKTTVGNVAATTNTPLAETLADIYFYFVGENSPVQYWCQTSYVVIMTDGQSVSDEMEDPRFHSVFDPSQIATWGDGDDHDPRNDSENYCPNNSCWTSSGSDYLDDVAYYMYHNDLFPNEGDPDPNPDMPEKQYLEIYTIGFNIDNDLLRDTAKNGNSDGEEAYLTASNYTTLRSAFTNLINNILLREFAFSSFTPPKRVNTALGEGFSYVGYFLPSSEAIWQGHLQAHKLVNKWFYDQNSNGEQDESEQGFLTEAICRANNDGKECVQNIEFSSMPDWDVATVITSDEQSSRRLFFYDSVSDPHGMKDFTSVGNLEIVRELCDIPDGATGDTQTQQIVDKIKEKHFGDVFHSDIAYVGPPLPDKKFLTNLNPSECDTTQMDSDGDCYLKFYNDQMNRKKVVYVGTNDGILHQINAETGVERWGFIPDDIMPSLKNIVIDDNYTYTVDGRVVAEDIYYRGTTNSWKTILCFGLRDGGRSYYTLDISTVADGDQPQLLWKFKDEIYSGKSWGQPSIGKIRYKVGSDPKIDKWVVIFSGGFAFNNENSNDLEGKALFVVDASTGDIVWMIGYDSTQGGVPVMGTPEIDLYSASGNRYLTKDSVFNYSVPSAVTIVDKNNDGYLDSVYFGNVAGHLFKVDMYESDPSDWNAYLLLKRNVSANEGTVRGTIDNDPGSNQVATVQVTDRTGNFAVGSNVFGTTSKTMGFITNIDENDANKLTVQISSPINALQTGETIVVPEFDPIFIPPVTSWDNCNNFWIYFGTGDRVRSRTNPKSGKFFGMRDGMISGIQKTEIQLSDLVQLSWASTNPPTMNKTDITVTNKWGWYFDFPFSSNSEKLFDPTPKVLPDTNFVPHLYLNTYQPMNMEANENLEDPCDAPIEGQMYFYDFTVDYCNDGEISAEGRQGRIAGGGIFQGTEYIIYEGIGKVGSIPPLQNIIGVVLPYRGGVIFVKEVKR